MFICGSKALRNLDQAATRCQSITVAHLPETVIRVPQPSSEVCETVDLVACRLADLPIDRCKVVSINRSGTSRNSTRRPLGMIIFINAHTMLRGDAWRHHFKQIERGRHWKERASIRYVCMQRLDVCHYSPYRYVAPATSTSSDTCS